MVGMYADTSPAFVSMIGSAVKRTGAALVAELGGTLEQAAVQVEDVAGIRLAARRAAQQQRHLAVGLGLLRQVVVHDERVLAVLHPVLTDGAAGVGSEVLERRRIAGRCGNDDGVLHRAVLAQRLDGLGDGGALLADGDVDALHAEAALVDDRVDGDSGLAGLAVADDQLALATADRGHRVDRLDAGLQRLVHRLAAHDARRLDLDATLDAADDVATAVDRLAERVDDSAEHRVADGHAEDAAGGLHGLALLDAVGVAEDDGADRLLVEVQRQPDAAVFELEQLVDAAIGQAADAGDAVADLGDAADGAGLERGLETLQVLLECGGDVAGAQREFCHGSLMSPFGVRPRGGTSTARCGYGRCRR